MAHDLGNLDHEQLVLLWTETGYIDPSLPAETKSALREIEYDMRLEDLENEWGTKETICWIVNCGSDSPEPPGP